MDFFEIASCTGCGRDISSDIIVCSECEAEYQASIDNALSDLRAALYGLPFVVVDRSNVGARGAFFDICHVLDGETQPALGFVAEGYTDGGWFGAIFEGKHKLSDRKPNMRAALVWTLNEYINIRIGK